MSRLTIIGAGGVGRETYDAVLAAGLPVEAFADDQHANGEIRGLPVLAVDAVTSGSYVIGIADPGARQRLAHLLDDRGVEPFSVIHPRALIAPETTLGDGCIVLAHAHVSSSVTVGKHCQVHYNATVGHDARFDDRVTVYPGANVSGSVHLESDVTVGSNAVVLQGRRVAAGAFVGAGAVGGGNDCPT